MVDKIKIEEGVPIPDSPTVPINELEVGQSILFPLSKRMSVQANVSRLKKVSGKDFTVKKVDEKTARVWRTG